MNAKAKKQSKEVLDLSDCMQAVIRNLQEEKKYPAVHTYGSTLNSFIRFSGGEGAPMPVDEVFTAGRLKSYEEWMMVRQELSLNTVSTYMRTLRAVYNRLYLPGSPEHDPKLFGNVHTKVESQTKRALTGRQASVLMNADLDKFPEELSCVLAYFLLMFQLRGMPFIDLAYLRKQDMRGNLLVYRRHKTGRQMTVRIPKEAVALFRKFRNKDTGSVYMFPILSRGKETTAEVYRNYQGALREFNKGLNRVSKLLLPGVKLSSYTARHTWATLAYHLGMPVGVISEALGHSSVRVTETYLKPFGNQRIDKANDKLISSVVKRKENSRPVFNTL